MIESKVSGQRDEAIRAADVVDYVFQISAELAGLCDQYGLSRLAAALELAHSLAAEARADQSVENAAPDEAT
jgi:hypothetical protein